MGILFKRKSGNSGIAAENKTWPLVIGGCFRSGTTLLRRLLDAHSMIFCGPEVKFFRDFQGDYLSDDLAPFRFFKTVRSLGLDDDELLDIFGGSYVECLNRACAKAGKQRWAEKTPENVLYLEVWKRLLGGRFHFILVVRHPLDTLSSMLEHPFPRVVPHGFEGKVATYRLYVEHGINFSTSNPDISQVVRYEDLAHHPEKTLSRLLAGVGEKFEPQMLVAFNSRERRAGIEDPKINAERHVHSKSVGRYLRDLQPSQISYAVKELGTFFKRFDYPLPNVD